MLIKCPLNYMVLTIFRVKDAVFLDHHCKIYAKT